jgi:hypothetical protein
LVGGVNHVHQHPRPSQVAQEHEAQPATLNRKGVVTANIKKTILPEILGSNGTREGLGARSPRELPR